MGYLSRQKNVFVTPDIQQTKGFDNIAETAFSYVKGRMFGGWIDDNSRSNGFNSGDLIENPAYILESILRDEVFVERDLTIDSLDGGGAGPHVVITGLKSLTDDYYNGAYIHNVTVNETAKITDYVGSTQTITVTITAPGGWDASDNIYVTNIQADNKIDYASFDAVGNTTDGTRKNWAFYLSIHEETRISDLLKDICETGFLLLTKQYNKYRLVAIEETSASPDVWANPLKQSGRELINISPTEIDFLANDFKLNYLYHHGRKKFMLNVFVNKDSYSSGLTGGSTLQGLCQDVYDNYGVVRPLVYDYDMVRDNTTAELLFTKLVNWKCKQRLIVSWGLTMKDGIKYEIGDIVLLNHSLIPDTLRNSSQFMITGKEMILRDGDPHVIFTLIEIL